jgi:hypothetical protein
MARNGFTSAFDEEAAPAQARQEVSLHLLISLAADRRSGDQHQVQGLPELCPVQSEHLPKEAAGTVSGHRWADPSAGDNTEAGGTAGSEPAEVQNHATTGPSFALRPESGELGAAAEAHGTWEPRAWGGGHRSVFQAAVKRFRPARRRRFRIMRPPLVDLRFMNPSWRFRRIFDG